MNEPLKPPERLRGSVPRGTFGRRLTPEEESLPDADDEFDDTMPADLWFRRFARRSQLPG